MAAKRKATPKKKGPPKTADQKAAEQMQSAEKAAASGGVELDPQRRAAQLMDQIQIFLQQRGATLVAQHGRPQLMNTPDGGMVIQLPPPQAGVAMLKATEPAGPKLLTP